MTSLTESEKQKSKDYLIRDEAHLIHPLHNRQAHRKGIVWEKANGVTLTDLDGKNYLDGISGLWNVAAGYGRRELIEAATRQMTKLSYASGYCGSTNPAAIELSQRLAEISYSKINRFFFTSGGAEANETAFKIARFYWKQKGKPKKTKVISRQWGYHGVTMAAMSATGIESYWPQFEPRVPGFSHIPSPYPYRYLAPEGVSQGIAAANELEKAILQEGPDNVAMFLAEPVQGAAGVIIPQDDYFPRIRQICDRYNVLLASDEVITGFGRTGKMWGLQHWNVEPDLMQFAKAITSGYFPFGGTGISDEIAEVFDRAETPWMHAYTYSAHPVGSAVALAMLDIVEKEDFVSQAEVKGHYLLARLRETFQNHPHVGEVRGLGLMAAVEIVKNRETKENFPAEEKIGPRIQQIAQENGLFGRIRGDVYCLAPPIVTKEAQIDRMIEILKEAVQEVIGPV